MNFNHDTGLIESVLILDPTISPPAGGVVGVLDILGTGAIKLPVGTTGQQPSHQKGLFRYNDTNSNVEFNNGAAWTGLGTGTGTVTSIAIAGSTGLGVSGSPITTNGTITLTLGTELQGLSGLASNGIISRTGAGTYSIRTVTGTASNIVVTNGDGVSGNPTINLATAGTPVTAEFKRITTDTFGRVTATSSVIAGDITTALGYTPINKAGDSMSSAANLTFSGGGTVTGLPTPSNASDAASKSYVDAMSQGLDPKGSVRVATTGAGTLATSFANGQTIDGIVLATGNRILIKNQGTATENGIYVVQSAGAPVRATDNDSWSKVPGAYVFVEEGTTLQDTGWVCTSDTGGTIGSTNMVWAQFSGIGTYTNGTGLSLSGNMFSLTIPVVASSGGTGLTSVGSANQVLGVVNAGGTLEYKTVASGTAINVVHTANTITVNNTGVTQLTGTSNQIVVSGSTGSVTLSLPATVTIGTSLTVGGLTPNSFLYSGAAGLLTTTSAPTNGQLLIGSTGVAPVAATLTQGTGISVTNGAGSITIANTGVTSVALAVPAVLGTVSGSPVTTTGTLTFSLSTQTANTFFSGPTSSSATPTFRSITYGDLPILLYKENPSSPTTPVTSGTNAIAIGSGSSASATEGVAIGSGSSAYLVGAKTFANGRFTTNGDAQCGMYVLRNITSNATPLELYLDGVSATQRLVLPNNSLWTFDIMIAARRTDATGGGSGYRITGVIRRDASAASTTFTGTPSKQILGETNSNWDVAVTANTTNGALQIAVTGEAAKTIRWVATVMTIEVTN